MVFTTIGRMCVKHIIVAITCAPSSTSSATTFSFPSKDSEGSMLLEFRLSGGIDRNVTVKTTWRHGNFLLEAVFKPVGQRRKTSLIRMNPLTEFRFMSFPVIADTSCSPNSAVACTIWRTKIVDVFHQFFESIGTWHCSLQAETLVQLIKECRRETTWVDGSDRVSATTRVSLLNITTFSLLARGRKDESSATMVYGRV